MCKIGQKCIRYWLWKWWGNLMEKRRCHLYKCTNATMHQGRTIRYWRLTTISPSSSTIEQNVNAVRSVLICDRRLTIRMIAEEAGITKSIVYGITTQDLNMRKACEKLVPKNLSSYQKEHRQLVCQDPLVCLERAWFFLSEVIIGDESWVFVSVSGSHSNFWMALGHVTLLEESLNEQINSQIKGHFFCIHVELSIRNLYLSNWRFYLEVLGCLSQSFSCVSWDQLNLDSSSRQHTALCFGCQSFWRKKHIMVLPYQSYSHELEQGFERTPFW